MNSSKSLTLLVGCTQLILAVSGTLGQQPGPQTVTYKVVGGCERKVSEMVLDFADDFIKLSDTPEKRERWASDSAPEE